MGGQNNLSEDTDSDNPYGGSPRRQRSGPRATLTSSVKLGGRGPEVGAISRNFERNLWNVGIQVQMPLIDGGSRRSQLGRAKINLKQSRLDREIRRRDITLQIKNVVRALAEAERQIELGKVRLEVLTNMS